MEKRSNSRFVNDDVKAEFDTPQYHLNGFTHPNLPIVTQEIPGILLPALWGIVPPNTNLDKLEAYYKRASKFGSGLNARSEKLGSHFLYKRVYKTQRCLIYVDAFFEPHHVKSKSYPYIVKRKDKQMMALAGIYTRFDNGLITCSILTKPASPYMAEIHNQKKRQPCMLNDALENEWLTKDLNEESIFGLIASDYNDEKLDSYPVNNRLHNPNKDSNIPEILEPFNYPELNRLF